MSAFSAAAGRGSAARSAPSILAGAAGVRGRPRGARRALRRWAGRIPFARRLGAALARLLQLDDTPESVARGVALGLLVAFTPTIGIQMGMVVVIHTLCRANRLAGIAVVWIANPLTLVPLYWLDYLVGRVVLGIEGITYERFQRIFELESSGGIAASRELIGNLTPVLGQVGLPMVLGGILLGLALAIPAYPLTVRLVARARGARARLEELRMLRRSRQAERRPGRLAVPV